MRSITFPNWKTNIAPQKTLTVGFEKKNMISGMNINTVTEKDSIIEATKNLNFRNNRV